MSIVIPSKTLDYDSFDLGMLVVNVIFQKTSCTQNDLIEYNKNQLLLISLLAVHCLSSVICSLGLPFMLFYKKLIKSEEEVVL